MPPQIRLGKVGSSKKTQRDSEQAACMLIRASRTASADCWKTLQDEVFCLVWLRKDTGLGGGRLGRFIRKIIGGGRNVLVMPRDVL